MLLSIYEQARVVKNLRPWHYIKTAGTGKSAAPAVEVTSIAVCYCAPKMLVNFSSIEPEFSLM